MAAPMGHGHGGGMHGLEKPKDFKGTLGKLIKKFIFPVTGRSLGCLMECEEVGIHGKHYKRRTIGFD